MEGGKSNGKKVFKGILTVMAIIILILVSALIVSTFLTIPQLANSENEGTVTNETITNVTNLTTSSFAILSTYPSAVCVVDSVLNSSGGEVLAAGNYTATSCTLILEDDSSYIGEDLNVTYTYSSYVKSAVGINSTEIGIQFGLFIAAIVAFFSIIGVIIGLIWLILSIKPLFEKKGGIQSFGG